MNRPSDDVSVGTIRFDTDAEVIRGLKSIKNASFSTALNAPRLCRNDGWTNYRAAFDLARQQLRGVDGRKVIYFITDGDQQSVHLDVVQIKMMKAVTTRMQHLRQLIVLKVNSVAGLTVNAVFLASKTGGAERDLLNQITGDANRVKFANDTSALTDKLIELSFPPVQLQSSATYGDLTAPGASSKSIGVTLTPDTNRPGVYFYQTEAFIPLKTVKAKQEIH